jgi:hypothetical protein
MLLTHHFTIKSFDVQGGKRKDAAWMTPSEAFMIKETLIHCLYN